MITLGTEPVTVEIMYLETATYQLTNQPPNQRTHQPTNSNSLTKLTDHLTDYMEQSSYLKLQVPQLVKKFPTFYGTQRFITMFKITHPLSLPSARLL